MFGIFTHAQMDHRLWHCVSSFLSSRSKEYRERCVLSFSCNDDLISTRCLARCLHSEGPNTYLPILFSESDAFQQEEPLEFTPSLPANEANQVIISVILIFFSGLICLILQLHQVISYVVVGPIRINTKYG